jgi:predicted enzyme related to lactoylglutathione lyase
MPNPVVHFEVLGRDGEKLRQFYADAFGWQMEEAAAGYAMALPGGGGGINGGVGKTDDGGPGYVTFYVEVDDLDEMLNKLESLGGRRLMGPMDVPDGPTIAMFADPEGHPVGLVKAGSRGARD